MANIGSLVAHLKADTKNFDRNLNRSLKHTRDFSTKISRSFGVVKASIRGLSRPLMSLQGQLLAIVSVAGVGMLGKSFLNASRETENYRLRLNALLGSVVEGNRMFKAMSTFAGKVPFAYDKIMSAATQLSGIMRGGVTEVSKWMPLIADLAAVSGLGIEKTTEQIVRMYSAGAASADLFRERGITAMLGFQAKTQYSAEVTRKMLMEAWNAVDSRFRGATKEMAKSWDGLMSMIGDKWFQIRNMIMNAGIYDALKDKLAEIDKSFGKWIEDNKELIKVKVPEYLDKISEAAKTAWGFLKWVAGAVSTLWKLISSLPKGFLTYLDNMAKRSDEAAEKIKKLNDEIANIKPPPVTTWDRFWNELGFLGKNIIDVFAFAGKAFGAVLGVMASDAIAFVVMVGEQFMNLGEVMWKAMTFDIKGARESYGKLKTTNKGFLKEIAVNWQAYEDTIYGSWNDLLAKIEARMYVPPPKVPEMSIEEQNLIYQATPVIGPPPPLPPPDLKDYEKALKDAEQLQLNLAPDLSTWDMMERQLQTIIDAAEKSAQDTIDAAENSKNAYADMYGSLKWEAKGYFEYRKQALLKEVNAFKKATGDELLAQQYFKERMALLLDEQLQAHSQLHRLLTNLSQRTAEAMEQTFSDFYFDMMRGEFKDLGDYATGVLRSIQRATADLIGQMAKEALFGGGSSKAPGAISEIGKWVGSMFKGGKDPYAWGGEMQGFASGGSFGSGEMIRVGESGPEVIYTGNKSGQVIPTNVGSNEVSIQVNIINESGEQLTADQGEVQFDGQKYITEIHIDKMINSRSYRQMNKQAVGGR